METLWNGLLTVALLILTGAVKMLYDSLKELQSTDKELAGKVASIEVLVAGRYVTTDELNRRIDGMMDVLNDIDTKLDTKVSRMDCPIIHEGYRIGGRRRTDPKE